MKRRTAVQGIILFSLGTGVIFGCNDQYKAIRDLGLKHLQIEDEQIDIIDQLASSILPTNKIPALEKHTSTPFILKMIDDCLSMEDRKLCIAGYQTFDLEVKQLKQKLFSEMLPSEVDTLVKSINAEEVVLSESSKMLFDTVKKYSITYLLNTEFVQRNTRYYEMAPAYYKGDIHMDEWSNRNVI